MQTSPPQRTLILYKKCSRKETIVYPENAFFTLPKTMKRVMDGEALYDRPSNIIWNFYLIEYSTAMQFWNYADKRLPGQPMPPMKEMVQGLLNNKGLPNASFAENAKKLGFKASTIDPQKMIVLWAWPDCGRGGVDCVSSISVSEMTKTRAATFTAILSCTSTVPAKIKEYC